MKSILLYAVLGIATATFSAWVFHEMNAPLEDDAFAYDSRGFDERDIEAAVDRSLEEYGRRKLMDASGAGGGMVELIQEQNFAARKKLDELNQRLARLDGSKPAEIDPASFEIPRQDKIEELVAQAMTREQERASEERRARREEQRVQREQQSRERTLADLKEKLSLTDAQLSQVEKVYDEVVALRTEMFESMRQAREEGGADFDWRSMRGQFDELRKQSDERMAGILVGDQQQAWTQYQQDNPMGLVGGGRGFGGGRGGARGPGGGGGRGGRGGR